jgi:hypothetical protein
MKVLVYLDPCGHYNAFDVSTEEKELKVLQGLLNDTWTYMKKDPVPFSTTEEGWDLLEESFSPVQLCRGSLEIVDVKDEWSSGLVE